MKELMDIFKALSDETRLRILKLLEHGELCVCDIVAALGMIQPKVSFHLAVMKDAGLIKDRKQGRWMYYSLNVSDVFVRFLLLGVFERIDDKSVEEDKRRLMSLLSTEEGAKTVPMIGRIKRGGKC